MDMESPLPNSNYGGISRYMRRRHYQRLDGGAASCGGKKMKIIRFRRSPHRYWRIRAIPRLRWVMRSPIKMLAKLKNAYLNLMVRVAGNIGAMTTDNLFGVKWIPKALSKGYSVDDFEARLIYEISKALVASHELYPM